MTRATLTFDVRHRLAEIAVPRTIIHGGLDATVPVGFASLMGAAIAGATVQVIEGQGQFPNLEAPDRFTPIPAAAPDIEGALVPPR